MAEKDEIKRLRAALEDIANPIAGLKAYAESKGARLDGHYAILLSNDPNWLKDKARKALESAHV